MKQLLLAGILLASNVFAQDWPQLLGPQRDGTYTGPLAKWRDAGPRSVWKTTIGSGWSAPVAAGERVIIFYREGNEEIIRCHNSATGKVLWKHAYVTQFRDRFGMNDGPRSTPAIDGEKVFAMGAGGHITALNLQDGRLLWKRHAANEFQAGLGFFGIGCSPLVHNGRVLLNIGGANGAGIIALNTSNGQLAWKTSNDETSYSSPIIATLAGKERALFFTRAGLEIVDPANGREFFKFAWRPKINASVNAATPLIHDDHVFISTSYDKGGALISFKGAAKPKPLWAKDGVMSNQYATSVLRDGYLYGFHGRADIGGCELRCVELKTAKVKWRFPGLRAGTVTLAGKELIILTDRGEILRGPASPEAFVPTARAQLMGATVRAYPALANGKLYARNDKQLICVSLTGPGPRE